MSSRWTSLTSRLLDPLIRFLGPLESWCVSFTEQLANDGNVRVPPRRTHSVHVRVDGHGRIDGAILQSATGLFHPVLAAPRKVIEPAAVDMIRQTGRRLYSVMGRDEDVVALETAIRRTPVISMEYHHMTQQVPPPSPPLSRLPRGMRIRRAGPGDTDYLFDIQRLYEIEEVLLPGNTFDPGVSRRHLQETLGSQLVLLGEIDGTAVAKAGTNARGLFYDQIGGVFTMPKFRSRGVSTALMLRLLALIALSRKSASLFVKKDNGPALRVYRNLGFGTEGGFRISYFK